METRTDPRSLRPSLRRRMLGAILGLALLPVLAAAQDQPWIGSNEVPRVDKAQVARSLIVDATSLNLRPDPSLAKPPIGTVREGEVLVRVSETFNTAERRGWVKVRLPDGMEGWVASKYLEPVKGSLETVERAMRAVAAATISPAAGPVAARRKPVPEVRVGFVLSGPIGDGGWVLSHELGRRALEELSFVKGTAYVENVPEKPELVMAAIDELVEGGANLVFTTSFGFMQPTLDAAAKYPNVVFMHSAGFKTAPNMGTYFGRIYEARYLAGIVAGGMSESKIIGYVAAFPIAQVLRGINAFTLGAQSVSPDVQVRVLWTNTWYSPGIEKETTDRLFDFGADVVTMHQNSPAVLQAAEARGRKAIGYHGDMAPFAPGATMTSVVWDWAPMYRKIATDLHEGSWEPYQLWWGAKEGVVKLAPLSPDLPLALKERVLAAERDLKSGRLDVFAGTLRDDRGRVRLPSGQVLYDADLLSMDFFVLGVRGELPVPKAPTGPTN